MNRSFYHVGFRDVEENLNIICAQAAPRKTGHPCELESLQSVGLEIIVGPFPNTLPWPTVKVYRIVR